MAMKTLCAMTISAIVVLLTTTLAAQIKTVELPKPPNGPLGATAIDLTFLAKDANGQKVPNAALVIEVDASTAIGTAGEKTPTGKKINVTTLSDGT
ncbi:MAG TPA: hypothetical protein VGR95_04615, partial [Thermoanaerobaculia bacterium]|nr:hypothetical protein [Thermoanaerobaculia bacterium]